MSQTWQLVIERGGEEVQRLPLETGLVTIGRDHSNTIMLPGRDVSRCHAILIVDHEGNCLLQDVGSRNGTRLGGHPVSRVRLQPGDVFTVGGSTCRLDFGPAPEPFSAGRVADVTTVDDVPGGSDRPDFLLRQDPELFVGTSPAAQDLLRQVRRVAETRVSVLVTGESGSGKGVVGRLLHAWSPRSKKALVAVNCAAIPGELIESELFGHRKGSFTGASADRTGKFQAADGGTLFLDEVGDMSLAAQAKILRAIEEQTIEPVGHTQPVKIDVRVIAATNKDLAREVEAGRFRQDLLFRLATVGIRVPPLRERPDDIVLLANCLLSQLIEEIPRARGSYFSPEAVRALLAHPWPGNVRELRNAVAQALVSKDGDAIKAADLRLSETRGAPAESPTSSLEEIEASHIARALEHHGWNQRQTALALGISRKTLRDRVMRYGLKRPE